MAEGARERVRWGRLSRVRGVTGAQLEWNTKAQAGAAKGALPRRNRLAKE